MESFFHQLSGSIFIFFKNTHQKAVNFRFGLVLPVALIPAWFLGGQSKCHLRVNKQKDEAA